MWLSLQPASRRSWCDTIIRYDNAQEQQKGHERHTQTDIEYIGFPGMLTLYDRFKQKGRRTVAGLMELVTVGRLQEEHNMPTLKVTVGERDRLDRRTRSRIKAAQEGQDLEDAQPVLNFESYSALSRLLSPKNLELLESISDHGPESIREAAELVDRAVSQLIAGVMGDLARVEHKQKLRRIQSGIDAAKEAARWTGRPPAGFDVDDGYLQVNADEFLTIRRALERVEQGYTSAEAADGTPVAESTLRALYDDRRDLYFYAEAEDERLQAAAQELEPLEKPDIPDDSSFPEQDIRTIVRDEICCHQQ